MSFFPQKWGKIVKTQKQNKSAEIKRHTLYFRNGVHIKSDHFRDVEGFVRSTFGGADLEKNRNKLILNVFKVLDNDFLIFK